MADTGEVPSPPHPPTPFLILDQTDSQRAEKEFKTALPLPQPPSPYLSIWMTGPPPYLKVLIRHCTVYYTIRVGFNWNDWTKCESLTVLITAAVSFYFLFCVVYNSVRDGSNF